MFCSSRPLHRTLLKHPLPPPHAASGTCGSDPVLWDRTGQRIKTALKCLFGFWINIVSLYRCWAGKLFQCVYWCCATLTFLRCLMHTLRQIVVTENWWKQISMHSNFHLPWWNGPPMGVKSGLGVHPAKCPRPTCDFLSSYLCCPFSLHNSISTFSFLCEIIKSDFSVLFTVGYTRKKYSWLTWMTYADTVRDTYADVFLHVRSLRTQSTRPLFLSENRPVGSLASNLML